mmetsp:Transcript_13196/g.28559  ORF Transcript_13196/g.28559 Transcript_13196/m.28559 type:complete len:127 (+) Transcript_13196:38-418(+)
MPGKKKKVIAPAAAKVQSGAAGKVAKSAIDDIFAAPVKEQEQARPAESRPSGGPARNKRPTMGSADDMLGRDKAWKDDGLGGVYNPEGWTGRRTNEDGLRIFKTHLLKIGQGGETQECPWDCSCCF